MPVGARAIRWAALFSSPFFHPTVVVDRAVLERHELRYDTSFAESEDYDLWARLLDVADGDNVPAALVLYRRHDGQASTRRAELQLECRRRVALRQIEQIVPDLTGQRAELAWRAGGGLALPAGTARQAADALRELVEAFEARYGGREARRAAAWALARSPSAAAEGLALARAALALDPALPVGAVRRVARRRSARAERAAAGRLRPRAGAGPVRLTIVLPEPTPYRTGMLDRLAERPDLDLTVVYAAPRGPAAGVGRRAPAPCRARRRHARPGRFARAPARLPAVARHLRRAYATPTPTSSSSRAGARSLRRQRSPGVGGTASPTCSSSSRTSATPGPAGGGR